MLCWPSLCRPLGHIIWYELLEHIQLFRVNRQPRLQYLRSQLQCPVSPLLRAAEYNSEVRETRVRQDYGGRGNSAVLLCVSTYRLAIVYGVRIYLSNHTSPTQHRADLDNSSFTHLGRFHDGIRLNHNILA